MANIVILGAGLGGMPMAYEMKELLRAGDTVTVLGQGPNFHFVPSNPWVAVSWRKRSDIEFPVAPYLDKKGIRYNPTGAKRVHPEKNAIELNDGSMLAYDYLVIATGPKLAFDEIEGLGPQGHTQSICHVDHAERAAADWDALRQGTGPDRRRRGAGRLVLRPRLRVLLHHGNRPAPAQDPRQGADDLRHRRALHRPPGPGRRRRLEGRCSSRRCATSTSSGSATPRSPRSRPARCTSSSTTTRASRRRSTCCRSSYSMMLPAFKGIDAVFGIEGLTNPRGFILIDEHQRNPKYRNIYAVGVCVAIPPVEATPVPTGAPKTGYMIESMVTATAHNIRAELDGKRAGRQGDLERGLPRRHGRHRASRSSRCRRSRRATSTGSPRASGCTSPRSASRSTSSAR